jgi:hypothetical protein
LHIGKKTWEIGDNSYSMNNVEQFKYNPNNVNVCVIKTSLDNWKLFKKKSRNIIKFIKPFESHKKCFESIIAANNNEKYIIIEDTVKFTHNINDKLETLIPNVTDNMFVIIGDNNSVLNCLDNHYIVTSQTSYNSPKYCFILDKNILNDLYIDYTNVYTSLNMLISNKYILDKPIVSYRKDKFIFLQNMDSYDYDITRINTNNMSVEQLQDYTYELFGCVGFNTYGYYKYIISDYSHHKRLNGNNNGLYINQDKWIFSQNNQKIIKHKINNCIRNDENNIVNNITFTITTCKRLNYFIETMDTFILKCNDINFIDLWICIDDNSSNEDRQYMKHRYPFFTYIFKDISTKGHANSMNILWKNIKTDYVLHYEDDWKIIDDFKINNLFNYVTNNCDQLIFVQQPREFAPQVGHVDGYNIIERIYNTTHKYKNINHYNHDNKIGITQHNKYLDNATSPNRYWWWPGFSLNPSIFNFTKISKIGDFITDDSIFEYDYASRCFINDINIHLVNVNIGHIGIMTSYEIDRA